MNLDATDQSPDCIALVDGRARSTLTSKMFIEGIEDYLLDVGCRNTRNRSDLGSLEMSRSLLKYVGSTLPE